MADILGVPIPAPETRTGRVVAGVAVVGAVGAVAYGVRTLWRRTHPVETEEERVARMERIAHLDGVFGDD